MTTCKIEPKSQYENWCVTHDRAPVECAEEIVKAVIADRDQLRADLEKCKQGWHDGAPELLTMMIEADHMLGHYSTTRLALKALLKKYADVSIKAADAELQIRDLVDRLNKHTDAMDDARGVIQERYHRDPDGYGKAGTLIDTAFETLCPQCHHGTWSQEGGICTAMCRPDPGETEYWKCNCSRDYHRGTK